MNPALTFVLLCLASYRLTRIITADDLTDWFREGVALRAEDDGLWVWHRVHQLIECPWCWGWWTSLAVVAWAAWLIDVPAPLLQAPAVACVVGMIGSRFDG